VQTEVPRERVLSIPQTGFGSKSEGEFVVLGGKDNVRALVTKTYDTIPNRYKNNPNLIFGSDADYGK